jgi:DNA-binding response OmpR family regulator
MTNPRILLVEDEEAMIAGLEYALGKEGFEVVTARDGEAGIAAARDAARRPDLVLLDLMLPKRSGFEVLQALRQAGVQAPVIVLTAKGQEADKVRGFDLGADDYVTKPFGLAELLARIRARLRSRPGEQAAAVPERVALGGATVDFKALSVTRGGVTEELSVREADMLRLLWKNAGTTVPRRRFLQEVWGHERAPVTRTVDQHVVKLRQKIEPDPANPRHILTVVGIGYRLET